MTIKNWQKKVNDWINQYGVRYFSETTNNLLLVEEVGEFTRHIARIYGEQSYKTKEQLAEGEANLKDEMGDILFVLTCMANQMNMDLEQILEKNIEKKTLRDHKRHQNNPKLQED